MYEIYYCDALLSQMLLTATHGISGKLSFSKCTGHARFLTLVFSKVVSRYPWDCCEIFNDCFIANFLHSSLYRWKK